MKNKNIIILISLIAIVVVVFFIFILQRPPLKEKDFVQSCIRNDEKFTLYCSCIYKELRKNYKDEDMLRFYEKITTEGEIPNDLFEPVINCAHYVKLEETDFEKIGEHISLEIRSIFRENFIKTCMKFEKDDLSGLFCECVYNSLIKEYGYIEVIKMINQLELTNNFSRQWIETRGPCAAYYLPKQEGFDILREIENAYTRSVRTPEKFERKYGKINQDEEIKQFFSVDVSILTLSVDLLWEKGDLKLTLIKPDGTEVSRKTVDQSIVFRKEKTFENYRIETPDLGDWQIKIVGLNVPQENTFFYLHTFVNSNMNINTQIISDYQNPGDSIKISTEINDGGVPITDAYVFAIITPPEKSMQDNITVGFNHIREGIYMGEFNNTNWAGNYYADIMINGRGVFGFWFQRSPWLNFIITESI